MELDSPQPNVRQRLMRASARPTPVGVAIAGLNELAAPVSALLHSSRWARWVWYALRLAILFGLGSTLVYLNEYPVISAAGVSLVLGFLLLVDRSQLFKLWACYVVGIVVFTHLRTLADLTFISTKYLYVIEADRLLFFGNVPTVWLQDRFYEFGQTSSLVSLLVAIHLSYFVFPHAVAAAMALWSKRYFALYVAGILATFYIGLLIYFAVPTSPPWLASYEGHLPEVTRVLHVLGSDVSAQSYEQGHRIVGSNDVAAMPSLHFAITAVIMLAHWRFHWILRTVTVVYTALMGLALVYLAEHYVIDLLVGLLVALAGWWVANCLIDRYYRDDEEQESSQPAQT